MRFTYFIPFIFLGLVGCDAIGDRDGSETSEPLVHRFDKEAQPKAPKVKSGGHDPEVVPETDYPSIFEAEVKGAKKSSSVVDGKKASKVLNIGKEKIKVYDESMGSVNEDSLKKLRKQVN